jgi:hypothetical protein
MAFTLDKALKNLASQYGRLKGDNWKLSLTQKVNYAHTPLSSKPIFNMFFGFEHPQPGNSRTVNVAVTFRGKFKPHVQDVVTAGPVFRMVSDLSDMGQTQISMDMGSEQTNPLDNEYCFWFTRLWQAGRYIRIPNTELPDQIRYKMEEVRDPIYLFPDENGVVPKKKSGGGCPFGFGGGDEPKPDNIFSQL